MSNLKLTIELDLTPAKDMLKDYFDLELPDDFLVDAIKSSGTAIGEIYDKAENDTAARGYILDLIIRKLPNSRNKHWPVYGDSQQYKDEFAVWLDKALKELKTY